MISLKKILVPTDFSGPSAIALKYARALAQAFQGALEVVHVIEDPVAHAWAAEVYVASLPGLYEELEREVRGRLQQLVTSLEQEGVTVRGTLMKGNAFIEIIRFAREQEVDLIVMGTHGRSGVAQMLMGSVAEKVVRKAPCPVLTVRHPQHEFVMP
jgi:nucleotide-binding universal stress UspA family protein